MATKAHDAFKVNIERARDFLRIHEGARAGRRGAPPNRFRELPRGAIVFAVGALDAYLCEVSAHVIVTNLRSSVALGDTRAVLKQLHADLPTLALEIALVEPAGERVQRLIDIIVDHFHNRVSMHGAKAVAATVARMGTTAEAVWSRLRDRHVDAASELDEWTVKRHQIVHQGMRVPVPHKKGLAVVKLVEDVGDAVEVLTTPAV